jgi:hypothetical protein
MGGSNLTDLSNTWVAGATVADARTHSACVQMRYTGSTMNCAGTVAVLTNIPHDLFVGSSTMPSVDQLFAYSRDIRRVDFGVHEVRSRPDLNANAFYDSTDAPFNANFGTVATGETSVGVANTPRAIGFAWKGVSANADLMFTRYKVIEWRPYRGSGMPPVRIQNTGVPPLYNALAALDRSATETSDWTTSMEGIGRSIGKGLKAVGKGVVQSVFAPGNGVNMRTLGTAMAGMLL